MDLRKGFVGTFDLYPVGQNQANNLGLELASEGILGWGAVQSQ